MQPLGYQKRPSNLEPERMQVCIYVPIFPHRGNIGMYVGLSTIFKIQVSTLCLFQLRCCFTLLFSVMIYLANLPQRRVRRVLFLTYIREYQIVDQRFRVTFEVYAPCSRRRSRNFRAQAQAPDQAKHHGRKTACGRTA